MKKSLLVVAVMATVSGLVACGGGGSSPTSPATPVPTPAPSAAAITASGAGTLMVHPSKYSTWAYAIECPVRIRETGGGKAKWNYAHVSLMKAGREIERAEIGADILAAPPDLSNIAPLSDDTIRLYFRLNNVGFDRVDLTLGFTDVNSLRQFTVDVPFSSFSGVDLSLEPASRPAPGVARLP
jgi:hypothetical protein